MLLDIDYRALAHAGQEGLPLKLAGAVVAIGNFDGVHLGHQALLAAGRSLADKAQVPLVALSFWPHPRRHFQPQQPPFLLQDATLRAEDLQHFGVDAVVQLHFDAFLASVTAEQFVDHILGGALQASHVIVGEGFVFGAQRAGTVALLKKLGKTHGFRVTALPPVSDADGARISSGRVRSALQNGQPLQALDLLGRPWVTRAEVTKGDQRGRLLGFPTANMTLHELVPPKHGVYAARVQIEGEKHWYDAVAHYGPRASFGDPLPGLEAHLFDFSGDLYGKILRMAWYDFLRPPARFATIEALQEQITTDAGRARELLLLSQSLNA